MAAKAETDSQAPDRVGGLLGIFGAVLIIVSWFLPSTLSVNADAQAPYTTADFTLKSNWDMLYQTLYSGGGTYDPVSGNYSVAQLHLFAGLAFGFPLLMAGVALAMGVWAIFRRPGALRAAIFTAAAVIIALHLESFVNLSDYYGYSTAYVGPALQSLGLTVAFLGTFIVMVAAFMGWRRSASA